MSKSSAAKKENMARIRTVKSKLYLDYRVNGERIRKSTGLDDTKENRLKLEKNVIPALVMKIKMGDMSKPEHKKFSYYFLKFVEIHQDDKSYHNRIYTYKKVNDHFRDIDISKITRLMVKEYLASLDMKDSTKKDYLNCIKGVLDIALDDELVTKNVASDIRFKRTEKEPIYPFSPREVALLLERSDGMLRNYLGIAFNTGMRSGEILGLMHNDILKDRITVKRSISKGRITSPKTLGSIRDIPMFETVRPFIESQKKLSNSLYLFDYDRKFLRDVSFFKRRWQQLIKDCGIEYRKLYSTRHTFITAMLNSEKFKIMEIAAIVGHTSPQMIMTSYAGFIKDSHLKVETNIDLFGHTGKKRKIEKRLKSPVISGGF